MNNKFYVYKWVDNNDNILYIGKTTNIENRTKQHIHDKDWINKDTKLYYAELPNKTDMDIYEIYYINKFKPMHNTNYMNEATFSFALPELKFKLFKQKEKVKKIKPNLLFFKDPFVINKNEMGESLKWLYIEVNNMDSFKLTNSYLYELIKDYQEDFVRLFYDLCSSFEERGNKVYLDKKKTLFFKNEKHIVSLFKELGIFDVDNNHYIFEEDIISYRYFERIMNNAIKLLKDKNIDLDEIDYKYVASTIIDCDTDDYMFKTLEDYKEYKKQF